MLGQKPVHLVGWNLGLRLYLLLVAIFIPTFLSYYVYTFRTIEALHQTEVDTVIRMASLRIEHLAATIGGLDVPGALELPTLTDELKRIAGDGEQQDALARELRRIASERQREALAQELAGIVVEPNGIDGLSLFVVSADGFLIPVA